MKKRLFALVLALCLCLCGLLSGCTEKSAFEVINTAVKNTEALDSMAAEMKMDLHMAMEGITMDIPITMNMQASGLKGNELKMYTDMSTSMLGQDVKMALYQEGSWVYISANGMNYKMSAEDAKEEYDFADDMDAMVQELPEELLKDVKLTTNKDGSQSVTLSVDGETFSKLYKDYINDVNSSAQLGEGDVTISNAVITITVKDGYILTYAMDFDMSVKVETITSTVKAKTTITYKDPGKAVTITPMEGYQDFEEMPQIDEDLDLGDEDLDLDLDLDFGDMEF